MSKQISLLIVDDSVNDAELMLREFHKANIPITYKLIETSESMRAALTEDVWDVILIDHYMPHFSSGEALAILREMNLDIPSIIVSGYLGEDRAVEAMKAGCSDYLTKNNLSRLVSIVERAIEETSNRRSRMQVEEELNREKELMSVTLRSIGDGVIVTDTQSRIVFLNHVAEELTGWQAEKAAGQSLSEVFRIIHKDTRKPVGGIFQQAMQDAMRVGLQQNSILISQTGSERYVSASGAPVKDKKGDIIGFVVVFRDIQQIREAEEQLRRERSNLKTILGDAPVGIVILDHQGIVHEANQRAQQIFLNRISIGLSRIDQLLGCFQCKQMGGKCRVSPNGQDCRFISEMLAVSTRPLGKPFEIENEFVLWREGEPEKKWLSITAVQTRIDDVPCVVMTIDDITIRKRTEKELRGQWDLLLGVATASSSLLTVNDYDEAIHQALGVLGKAIKVDRVRIFEMHKLSDTNERVISYRYEWHSERVDPQIDDPELQCMRLKDNGYDRWYRLFRVNGSINSLVRDLPDIERKALEKRGTISLVNFPLSINGRPWGFIQFEDCRNERIWTKNDMSILIFFGVNIGGFIQRKMAEDGLRQAIIDSEEANRVKSQFLANISHELRTPLNGIKGMTTLTLSSDLTPEQQQYQSMVLSCADTLLKIINDILDYSKIEASAVKIDKVQFSLQELLDQTLKPLTLKATDKGFRLICQAESDLPAMLVGDPIRLKQILNNLIDNAIKFTDQGEVRLMISREASPDDDLRLRFTVRDTGIGIADTEMQYLFKSFSQVDGTYTRKYGGTGLGLTISKQLVEMMGGEIRVNSRKGFGSEFSFSLPLETVQEEEWDENERKPYTITRSLYSLKVLLVEDERINRIMAANTLKKRGHLVEMAQNGAEALEIFKASAFDVILMDVQMPLMDGIEATQAIRTIEKERGGHVPIIALSAHAFEEDRTKFIQAGMDGYISKPFHMTELFELIEKKAYSGQPVISDRKIDKQLSKAENARTMSDDEGFLKDIIELYISDMPRLFQRMNDSLAMYDADTIERLAHSIKSSSAYVHAEQVRNAAFKIEMAARKNDYEAVQIWMQKIEEEFDAFRAQQKVSCIIDLKGSEQR